MKLRLRIGKVHAWDGVRLASGPRSAGRGTRLARQAQVAFESFGYLSAERGLLTATER